MNASVKVATETVTFCQLACFVEGIWEYVSDIRTKMHDFHRRLTQSKENVELTQKLMSSWSKCPLYERIEGKHSTLLNLADRDERLRKRYEEIFQVGQRIHQLLQVSVSS